MTKLFYILTLVSLLAVSAVQATAIKIIRNDWSSQIVFSHAVGEILEGMGYEVGYMSLNTAEQWGALTRGVAHVQLEVWEGTMSEDLSRFLIRDQVEVIKTYNILTREEWWYPKYVEELCPGLPDWRALNRCSKLFAKKKGGKGIYYAGPWEKPDEPRVRALGMNFEVQKLHDANALKDKLLEAVKLKKPIVLFNWTPNWTDAVIPGKFVEFPGYTPECETDPKWGMNKSFLHDCGNPKNGWLKSVSSKNMKNNWPCAYRFLQKLEITTVDLAEMAYDVDHHKMSYQEAAQKWVKKHKKRWRRWIAPNCRKAK